MRLLDKSESGPEQAETFIALLPKGKTRAGR
jgi:hypothetical protein